MRENEGLSAPRSTKACFVSFRLLSLFPFQGPFKNKRNGRKKEKAKRKGELVLLRFFCWFV